jgi:hypothetical protein
MNQLQNSRGRGKLFTICDNAIYARHWYCIPGFVSSFFGHDASGTLQLAIVWGGVKKTGVKPSFVHKD